MYNSSSSSVAGNSTVGDINRQFSIMVINDSANLCTIVCKTSIGNVE